MTAWILFLFALGLLIFLITLTVALPLGIMTCNSAGNSGVVGSITNFSPWSFTVAATTMDRTFQGKLVMGNNKTLSVNSVIDILSVLFPLCCYL
jgi:predicted secreted protein